MSSLALAVWTVLFGEQMDQEYDTSRTRRMLLLWLSLDTAMAAARQSGSGSPTPWDSNDGRVRETWQQITHPENFYALFEWLEMAADGRPADWALKALQVCQERRGAQTSAGK